MLEVYTLTRDRKEACVYVGLNRPLWFGVTDNVTGLDLDIDIYGYPDTLITAIKDVLHNGLKESEFTIGHPVCNGYVRSSEKAFHLYFDEGDNHADIPFTREELQELSSVLSSYFSE